MISNLSNIIQQGLNNPDCSFWVGMSIGEWANFKNIIILIGLYIAIKVVSDLLINPLIIKIKNKMWRIKK